MVRRSEFSTLSVRTLLSLVKSHCKKLKAEQLKCDLYFKDPSYVHIKHKHALLVHNKKVKYPCQIFFSGHP